MRDHVMGAKSRHQNREENQDGGDEPIGCIGVFVHQTACVDFSWHQNQGESACRHQGATSPAKEIPVSKIRGAFVIIIGEFSNQSGTWNLIKGETPLAFETLTESLIDFSHSLLFARSTFTDPIITTTSLLTRSVSNLFFKRPENQETPADPQYGSLTEGESLDMVSTHHP